MKKVDFPIDKHLWHPSPVPGIIVIISTYGSNGEPNIAPKSWFQMISMNPPIVMFAGGNPGNTTEKNVIETKCFAINFVHSSIAGKVFECVNWHGRERIEKTEFKLVGAARINAPLVDDCPAHLECVLHSSQIIGGGLVVFGEIIHASMRENIMNADPETRYKLLDQILFLENGVFAGINDISKV